MCPNLSSSFFCYPDLSSGYDFTNLKKYYDSSSSQDDITNQELIESLKLFKNCLKDDEQNISECLQNKEYDFTNLKKYYDSSSSEKDTTNQEFINSLKPFEDCLNGDKKKIGECLQGYDFPTTYRQYRLQIKNQQLTTRIENILTQNNTLEQIISQVQRQGGWLKVIFGWLISAIAISMGAPFWFNLLDKVVNVRNAGKPILQKQKTIDKKA